MDFTQFPDDEQRVDELRGYNILDSLTEKEYDDITRLASIICQTPVALVSFVDADRQWFKSKVGLDDSQTPREYSFCSHAIETPYEPFVVPDARLHDRFKDNPLVTGEFGIVFYAGIPLVTESGFGLGSAVS
ncbi:GAF domain-containing protein [Flavobacterium silvaticum]|uniref:GAF domain-containing protein n=1 Tax=Flavobacterium silvaticum TaxID=1852020 RepID=UPI001F384A87|nr:GAF domain-containing protein [Flavobacterium silvaticum]